MSRWSFAVGCLSVALSIGSAHAGEAVALKLDSAADISRTADGTYDLGVFIQAFEATDPERINIAEPKKAYATQSEYQALRTRIKNLSGGTAEDENDRAVSYLYQAYSSRIGNSKKSVNAVKDWLIAGLQDPPVQRNNVGGPGARAWASEGIPKPLTSVAPDLITNAIAQIVESNTLNPASDRALKKRLESIAIQYGARR